MKQYQVLLRKAREERGWSQKDVAEKLGILANTVSRWERGYAYPTPYLRQQLSMLYAKSPRELGLVTLAEDPAESEESPAQPTPLQQRIYIIAAPEDHEIAHRLMQDLTHSGIPLWPVVEHDLHSFNLATVRQALRQASSVVLIASPSALHSRRVNTQMEIAADYQRPIQVIWVSGEDGARPASRMWPADTVLDARTEHYETAKEALLLRLKPPPLVPLPSPEPSLLQIKEPRNPYKGLHTFTAQERCDFFGREALIDELTRTLEHILLQEKQGKPNERLLTILGASGSGKSSVVQAGLLPRLQQNGIVESQEWIYLDPVVPGTHPLEALAVSLARQPALGDAASLYTTLASDSPRALHLLALQLAGSTSRKVVLFLDQCEELFTLTISEEELTCFFDLLIAAVTEPMGPFLVLLTCRADLYHRALQYPALYRLLDAHRVSVFPMERDELRQVIEQPARLPDVQVTFEGDLVGDLLFDARGQAGTLPLLEFTLDQLFLRRSGHILTLDAYHDIGGVQGVLAKHAETTYAALPTEQHRKLTRSLFLRLIDPGPTEQDSIRHRAYFDEFELPDSLQTTLLRETMDTFLAARLLTTNEHADIATVEVGHEALIREWPLLRNWLREAREDMQTQQKISKDARAWQERHCPNDWLYRGSQLKEAQTWARRNIVSQQERTFLHAGVKRYVYFVVSVVTIVLLLGAMLATATWFIVHALPDPTLVTTLQNDGIGSLRWAIENAPSDTTITFASGLKGQTIPLTSTLSVTVNQLRIQGPGPTISDQTSGIKVSSATSLTFKDLTLTGGTNLVPLLDNEGTLTLIGSVVSGNNSFNGGGGIYNAGRLTLTSSCVSGNSSSYGGGGIFNDSNATATLTNSCVSGNSSAYGGGGILNNYNAIMTLTNSVVSGNTSSNSKNGNGNGGGIYNQGTLTLTHTFVETNIAYTNTGGGGGGIYNTRRLTLTGSVVSGNRASGNDSDSNGGGIYNQGTLTLVANSTVKDNRADISAGDNIEFL